MKKSLFVVLFALSLAWTHSAKAEQFFISLFSGFDYSFQGDIVEGLNDSKSSYEYFGSTVDESAFPAGVLSGLEFGMMFDKVFGISLSPEVVFGLGSSVKSTDGSDYENKYVTPNMVGGSLNVLVYLANESSAKTYIKAGGSFYHAFVDFTIEDSNPSSKSWGTFTGEMAGGLLEIGEEFDLGGGLSMGIAARGRLASLDKLICASPKGDAALFGEPFQLVRSDDTLGHYTLDMYPESFVDGSSTRAATLDMSGLDLVFSLKAWL